MKSGGTLVRVLVWSSVLFFFLLVTGAFGLFHPIVILLFGWISFLARVVPQVTMNWSGIGMVVVCSGLIVAAMHWLCQWLYAHWVRQGSANAPARWRWTWTTSLYGGLWLLFLAAMGVTGVVHQVGWLAASKEPLYVMRNQHLYWGAYLRSAHLNLCMAGNDADWMPDETRRAFESVPHDSKRTPYAPDDLHTIYIEGPSNKLAAVILFYRDPKKQEKAGFMLTTPNNQREEFRMDQLQTVLARYQR
jgi:lipid-A-disaccharide synthase-like uncharacterized protein